MSVVLDRFCFRNFCNNNWLCYFPLLFLFGLWVPHLYLSCTFWDRFMCIYKRCPDFCFCCRCHSICHDFSHIVDGIIVLGVFTVITRIMIAPHSATCLGFQQVWYIAVESQNHINLLVPKNGFLVADGIVEEPYYIIVGLLCGLGLVQCEVSQGKQHGGIHRQGIV